MEIEDSFDLDCSKGNSRPQSAHADQATLRGVFLSVVVTRVGFHSQVAGATNTTSHTVRAALHCIGVRAGFKLVSSFFVMALPDKNFGMVILTNLLDDDPVPEIVSYHIYDHLLGLDSIDWAKRLEELEDRLRALERKKR